MSLPLHVLNFLHDLGELAPIFTARPDGGTDYYRPQGWQQTTRDGNDERIAAWKPGHAVMAVMGGAVAGVDVDTKNGADPDAVRQLLDGLGVPIYAEVQTPSGGWHFYIAGHPDLPTVSATEGRDGLTGYPGVEIASFGHNLFLPGTVRAKYDGKGYLVVSNNLAALVGGGDPLAAEVFAGWVADNRVTPKTPTVPAAAPWDGTPPDKRQQAYLDAVLTKACERLSTMPANSGRNRQLFEEARTCGWYIAGAGLDENTAVDKLREAAAKCGLTDDDGERSVLATIASGLRSGKSRPKTVPPSQEEQYVTELAARPDPLEGVAPLPLEQAHLTFAKWLGEEYDLDALNAVLAAAAVERMDGDPLWLLIVSGSGNAKTETVQALAGSGALVTSTISSPGALLSATSAKDRTKDATGGLLRKIGDHGLMVIKDVTSILSMSRDMRAEVLGAIREVYDGRWSRNVGTDGGKTLDWSGRVVVVGAVTTAWDRAHEVIASMGDRFVLLRMDSTTGRQVAGRRAIGNTGHEVQMRAELSEAVAGVLAGADRTPCQVTEDETAALLAAADLVTLARTAVDYDSRGNVIDAHAPEMPTRFAKQLAQVLRGAVAIGMDRDSALRLAIRCARDSMPPLRLAILDDVAANPDSSASDVRKRIGKPWTTVDRQLQSLNMLEVLEVAEVAYGNEKTRWLYTVADGIDADALNLDNFTSFGSTYPYTPKKEEGEEPDEAPVVHAPPAKSGEVSGPVDPALVPCQVPSHSPRRAADGRWRCPDCDAAEQSQLVEEAAR